MSLIQFLLFLAIVTNIAAYLIYLYGMFKGSVKPHALTFLSWSIITSINFFVQYYSQVGESSFLLGVNALFCFIIFVYCLIKGEAKYDTIDWVCLLLAIVTIVLYVISKTPLYSVLLSCLIDIFAFVPSFRKSFKKPNEDSALTFFVSGLEYVFSFPAYGVFSFLVLAYPITILTLDFAYAGLIAIRRRQLKGRSNTF